MDLAPDANEKIHSADSLSGYSAPQSFKTTKYPITVGTWWRQNWTWR